MNATYLEQLREGRSIEELVKRMTPKAKERLIDVATGMVMAEEAGNERESA